MSEQINAAVEHLMQGRLEDAARACREILRANPNSFNALLVLGIVALQTHQPQQAAEMLARAVAVDPAAFDAHGNLGLAQFRLGQTDQALASFDHALALNSEFAEAHANKGMVLAALARFDDAAACYDAALALRPDFPAALIGRAAALHGAGRHEEALAAYDRIIAAAPGDPEAHFNRAGALVALKQPEQALAAYDAALSIRPDYGAAHFNRATLLFELRRLDAAAESYAKALECAPPPEFAQGHWLMAKLQMCDAGLEGPIAAMLQGINNGGKVSPPFPVLAVTDDPAVQRLAAQTWARSKFPAAVPPAFSAREPGQKIRLAYFSADFRDHPVSHLLAGLIEHHDRKTFEVVGFSFGPATDDAMRARMTAAFDSVIEVGTLSDAQAAARARDMGVDIAVDVMGFTQDSRTGIFAARAAPVQVNYLGYPGTMGADYIDYIIADRIVAPEGAEAHFSEKIVRLPGCYQPNDTRRKIPTRTMTRAEAGLPDSAFVFCCFNNSFKISPETFSGWMRILSAATGSVLWLLDDNPIATARLKARAAEHGVDPSRLIFAKRMAQAEHLARHVCADLFLDTLPFNAHTTASDALWTGLPILTRRGESFAGRVAASVLTTLGLPELITASAQDYETRAVALSRDPTAMTALRAKLAEAVRTSGLFDVKTYARGIEQAYARMHERRNRGLAPAAFDVG